MVILGIDLAWGEHNPDGVALFRAGRQTTTFEGAWLSHGDDALIASVEKVVGRDSALLALDAPVVVPNKTGSRPVDRLTHRLFHHAHAGCHPASQRRVKRPLRVVQRLLRLGYQIRSGMDSGHQRTLIEVYPHIACLRFFNLERILKYKRSPVSNRKAEFLRYQKLLLHCVECRIPDLQHNPALRSLLNEGPWCKPLEDRTDALLCALIGWNHWRWIGKRSEVLGDEETGFIIAPRPEFQV